MMWLQHDLIALQSSREAMEFFKKLGRKMDKKGWTIGLADTLN
jgi:hypothetical protein